MPPEVAAPAAPAETQAPQQPLADMGEMSDAEIMGRAMGDTRPRDEQGRFVSQQQPAAEAPAAAAPAAPAEPAAEAALPEDEVNWDEVKGVKIKVPMKDGDKEWVDELTLEDLRAGRMMQSDYTKKTQEIAERERQADAKAQAAVEKERTQYLQALGALQQVIQSSAAPELANVNWDQLAAENPAEYVRLSNRARSINEAQQRVRFEQEKVQAQQSKDAKERLDQAVAESKVKLKEAIPTWNDDLYQSLLKRSSDTYGFKSDEMKDVWDHRVMRVLHDAHQWRAMQEGKPLAEKKVVTVPNVLRPGNAKPKVDAKTTELQQNRARLAANGEDIDAAAALLGSLIGKR